MDRCLPKFASLSGMPTFSRVDRIGLVTPVNALISSDIGIRCIFGKSGSGVISDDIDSW